MKSSPRDCPVCGSNEPDAYLQKGTLRLVRCRQCAMIYVTPVPEEMASGEYYDQVGTGYYLSEAKLQSDYAAVRFERELRIFRKYCQRGTVLDVGCSSGAFLYQLNRRFPGQYDTLGTDVSGPPLDYAESRGITVVRGNFLAQAFGGERFDAVTFWAVLEHLVAPQQFLQKAATVLQTGGLCFVLVPNMRSLATRVLGARYRYIYPQHLNYFTGRTLRKLVAEHFSVLAFHSTHFNPIVIWQDWRGGGNEVPNNQRAQLLHRTTAYKQNPMLLPVKALYRIVEKMLGAMNLADNLVVVLRRQ